MVEEGSVQQTAYTKGRLGSAGVVDPPKAHTKAWGWQAMLERGQNRSSRIKGKAGSGSRQAGMLSKQQIMGSMVREKGGKAQM